MLEVGAGSGKLVAAVSAACVGGLVTGLFLASRKGKEKEPEKWIKVGTVSELIIYPVKSIPGIYVNEATASALGLKGCGSNILRDRVFLVVNSKGDWMNQKKLPGLALLRVEVSGDELIIREAENSPNKIAVVPPRNGIERPCRLYNDKVKAVDCGEEVATWLSVVLKTEGLRLYYHASEKTLRTMTKVHKSFPTFSQDHLGTFHDETSYLLLSEESIGALNARLEVDPVTHKNFRPTILIKDVSEPFAEDFWTYVRIGNEAGPVFKSAMPCARCALTQIDPKTGERRKDGEPLKSIKSIKRQIGDNLVTKLVEKKAILGTHLGIFDRANVKVKVGDPVYAALL